MKRIILTFCFLPLFFHAQLDTIFCLDQSKIACKITLVNNYNLFYTENRVGKSIEVKKISGYSIHGTRFDSSKPLTAGQINAISGGSSDGGLLSSDVKVMVENGKIVKQNKEFNQETVFADGDGNYLLAIKPGFATAAISADSIKSKKTGAYKANLIPIAGLDTKKAKNKIASAGFIDKTDKIRLLEFISPYAYTVAKLNTTEFKAIPFNRLNDLGLKMVNEDDDVFQQKNVKYDFALAGEIIDYQSTPKGTPGFIVSVVVRWTLYDVIKQENICKIITGGYSNSQKKNSLKDELKLALSDASAGLVANSNFVNSVYGSSGSETLVRSKSVSIREVVPSLNKDENYIQTAMASAVTIQNKYGHGSGFLISADGYILTNYHVIKDSTDIQAIFQNEMTLPLTIVAFDSKTDVALCKVPGKGYKPVPLDTLPIVKKVGSEVVAIGTPEDIRLGQTVTKGIVSGIREIEGNIRIQTDVAINSGNSGGMLINKNGEVIGIVASKIKKEGTEGLGFAVPIREAIKALDIKIIKKD